MTKKEALKTKDEPVAWGMEKDGVILDVICPDEHEREEGEYTIPLYTTPQRTWVELMCGVRVEGDTVVIAVKGGNDEARELCGALLMEKNT
jgi:hypothetical protein